MGFRMSKATDYGIRAMLHIASLPDDISVRRVEIAAAEKIPTNFMAKVLRRLVRHGLLHSSRGLHGGFCLARPATQISLLDMVEAIDGPISVASGTADSAANDWSPTCPASLVWPEVERVLRQTLGRYSLEVLVSAPRKNGRIAYLPIAGFQNGVRSSIAPTVVN